MKASDRQCHWIRLCAACVLLQGCSGAPTAKDSYFKCIGSLAVHYTTDLPQDLQDRQEIGAHITGDKILFSGHPLISSAEDIRICPPRSRGTSPDEYYFDSDNCSGTTSGKRRVYGTLNRITNVLVYSSTPDTSHRPVGDIWLVSGKFDCAPPTPTP